MTDLVNDYFQRFYPPADKLKEAPRDHTTMLGGMTGIRVEGFSTIFPAMKCADGFSVSVQGHRGAYSSPRDDFADHYSSVELGFPSAHEPLLDKYQDGRGDPTQTVYGYVPISVVAAIIEKHGGLEDMNDGLG
jgi:hypothetical protein